MNKLLKKRCGDKWEQRFTSKKLNIDEIVITKIPRLLPEDTIKKMHQRSDANLTYCRGQLKHKYLLGRMIFCEECGFALFGQANYLGKLYYRHPRDRGCDKFKYIPADLIDNAVINDIFAMLGDRPRIDAAIEAAIPNLQQLEDLKVSIAHNQSQLIKIEKSKERLIDQIADGVIAGIDAKNKMDKLKSTEALLRSQIESWTRKRESLPTQAEVTRKTQIMLRMIENILKTQTHLGEMSFDDKRKLLQYCFAGKDADGKRQGVYLSKTKKGDWLYSIKGVFCDENVIYKKSKVDMLGQCHAHHGIGLYQ